MCVPDNIYDWVAVRMLRATTFGTRRAQLRATCGFVPGPLAGMMNEGHDMFARDMILTGALAIPRNGSRSIGCWMSWCATLGGCEVVGQVCYLDAWEELSGRPERHAAAGRPASAAVEILELL